MNLVMLKAHIKEYVGGILYDFGRWIQSKSFEIRIHHGTFSGGSPFGDESCLAAGGVMPTLYLDPKDPVIREALVRGYQKATPDKVPTEFKLWEADAPPCGEKGVDYDDEDKG